MCQAFLFDSKRTLKNYNFRSFFNKNAMEVSHYPLG